MISGGSSKGRGMTFTSFEEYFEYVTKLAKNMQKGEYSRSEYGRKHTDFEDMVHDVYIKMRNAGFDWDTVPNRTYVYKIIRSAFLDLRRTTARDVEIVGGEKTPGKKSVNIDVIDALITSDKIQSADWFPGLDLDKRLELLKTLVATIAGMKALRSSQLDLGAFLLIQLRLAVLARVSDQFIWDDAVRLTEFALEWPEEMDGRRIMHDVPTIGDTWEKISRARNHEFFVDGLAKAFMVVAGPDVKRDRVYQWQHRAVEKFCTVVTAERIESNELCKLLSLLLAHGARAVR